MKRIDVTKRKNKLGCDEKDEELHFDPEEPPSLGFQPHLGLALVFTIPSIAIISCNSGGMDGKLMIEV